MARMFSGLTIKCRCNIGSRVLQTLYTIFKHRFSISEKKQNKTFSKKEFEGHLYACQLNEVGPTFSFIGFQEEELQTFPKFRSNLSAVWDVGRRLISEVDQRFKAFLNFNNLN